MAKRSKKTSKPAPKRGKGGETHQDRTGQAPALTTNQGTPISDNQNSLRAGVRGPTMLEDFIFREKITYVDHERIPERIVHARGSGAHGYFWDFVSLMPESFHMIMWAMSDRTIPTSLRMMEGFGVHTFRFVTAEGKSTFIKFHWRPTIGSQSMVWNESVKRYGADPDSQRRDLHDAIAAGDFPEWELSLQAFDQKTADKFPFDVVDPTKLIPEKMAPLTPVGKMVLDRNPDNFFAETEQVAFHQNC